MHILLMPDSFKGSLSATAVGEAMRAGILQAAPNAQVNVIPMADGGEGTMAAVESILGGNWTTERVRNANGVVIETPLLWLDSETVLLESAAIVGLPQAVPDTIWQRTTVGIGMAMRAAISQGARTILLGLGGSSTNDGGAGLLQGLGARLFSSDGDLLPAIPQALSSLGWLDLAPALSVLDGVRVIGLSDVDNPLCGPMGASAVYGPQKGLAAEDIPWADATLALWAKRVSISLEVVDHAETPGAGAAGGLGFAILALGGTLMGGANWLLSQATVKSAIQQADWIWTGEGRSDLQTLSGKLPIQVAKLARAEGKRVTLLSASIAREAITALSTHFDGCFSIAQGCHTLDYMLAEAESLVQHQASQLVRLRLG